MKTTKSETSKRATKPKMVKKQHAKQVKKAREAKRSPRVEANQRNEVDPSIASQCLKPRILGFESVWASVTMFQIQKKEAP